MVVLDSVVLDVVVLDVAVLDADVLDAEVAVVLEVAGAADVVELDCAVTELDVALVGAALSLSAEQADSPAAARIAIPRVTLTWEFMVEQPTVGRPAVRVPSRYGDRCLPSLGGRPLWH